MYSAEFLDGVGGVRERIILGMFIAFWTTTAEKSRDGACLMPRGPRGEKRPADVIGNAVKVMRIATGEETEELQTDRAKNAAAELGARGGKARAAKITPERRAEITRKAAASRWKRN